MGKTDGTKYSISAGNNEAIMFVPIQVFRYYNAKVFMVRNDCVLAR